MTALFRGAALGGVFLLAALPAFGQGDDRLVAERVLRLGGAVILEGQHRPILDLDDLPDTAFRLHTLDLVGVSMGAWGLKDELSRLPAIPHLKELYINGRLWYNQPVSLVADTIGLFSWAANLEKLVLSKPVQTYIPLEDQVLNRLSVLSGIEEMRLHQTRLPGNGARTVHQAEAPRSEAQPLFRRSWPPARRPDDRPDEAVSDRHVDHRRGSAEPRRSCGSDRARSRWHRRVGCRARAPRRADEAASPQPSRIERDRCGPRAPRGHDEPRGADALPHEGLQCRTRAARAIETAPRPRCSVQPSDAGGRQGAPGERSGRRRPLRRIVEPCVEPLGGSRVDEGQRRRGRRQVAAVDRRGGEISRRPRRSPCRLRLPRSPIARSPCCRSCRSSRSSAFAIRRSAIAGAAHLSRHRDPSGARSQSHAALRFRARRRSRR